MSLCALAREYQPVSAPRVKKTKEERGPRKRQRRKHVVTRASDIESNEAKYDVERKTNPNISPLNTSGFLCNTKIFTEWLHFSPHTTERSGFSQNSVGDDEFVAEQIERRKWSEWAVHAAEVERRRRILVVQAIDDQQHKERLERKQWAIAAIERERHSRMCDQFLIDLTSSKWFSDTVSGYSDDYELVCPYYKRGCRMNCRRSTIAFHLEHCTYALDVIDSSSMSNISSSIATPSLDKESIGIDADHGSRLDDYEIVCPNSILGCTYTGYRKEIHTHLLTDCVHCGPSSVQQQKERLQLQEFVLLECETERTRRCKEDNDPLLHRRRGRRALTHNHNRYHSHESGYRSTASNDDCDSSCSNNSDTNVSVRLSQSPVKRNMEEDQTMSLSHQPSASSLHDLLTEQRHVVLDTLYTQLYEYHSYRRQQFEVHQKEAIKTAIDAVKTIIYEYWSPSECCVESYGSFATDQFTGFSVTGATTSSKASEVKAQDSSSSCGCRPSANASNSMPLASDIDLVICFSDQCSLLFAGTSVLLKQLAAHIQGVGPRNLEITHVLPHAYIPLIKATSTVQISSCSIAGTGDGSCSRVQNCVISFDISIGGPNHTGLASTELLRSMIQALPPLAPIATVIKHYIRNNELSDPHVGGLTSYGIMIMILLPMMHYLRSVQAFSCSLAQSATPRADVAEHGESNDDSGSDVPPLVISAIADWSSYSPQASPNRITRPKNITGSSPVPLLLLEKRMENNLINFSKLSVQPTNYSMNEAKERIGSSCADELSFGSSLGSRNNGSLLHPSTVPADEAENRVTWDSIRLQKEFGRKVALLLLGLDALDDDNAHLLNIDEKLPCLLPTCLFPPQQPTQLVDESVDKNETCVEPAAHPSDAAGNVDHGTLDSLEELKGSVEAAGIGDGPAPPAPPSLGNVLDEFLSLYGDHMVCGKHGFSVRDGGFRFDVMMDPATSHSSDLNRSSANPNQKEGEIDVMKMKGNASPDTSAGKEGLTGMPSFPHPLAAHDPMVIEDPVNMLNNVSKNCYKAPLIQKVLLEAHERLKKFTVRGSLPSLPSHSVSLATAQCTREQCHGCLLQETFGICFKCQKQ